MLDCVQEAQRRIIEGNLDHEYLPIQGLQSFVDNSKRLAYGEDFDGVNDRVVGIQTLSGTGSLRVAMEFLENWLPNKVPIYVPNPTWGNHKTIAKKAGLEVREYKYYKPSTRGFDFEGMVTDLKNAPKGSIILLHPCAHNPTGVDPSKDQWQEIFEVVKKNELFAFFDSAYQGFATGDVSGDAYAIRLFAKEYNRTLLCQSFAKNFGLYGQRVGCLSFVTENAEEGTRLLSQLKLNARPMYSNPPLHGARIVDTVLSDPELKDLWFREVKGMADRIISMR